MKKATLTIIAVSSMAAFALAVLNPAFAQGKPAEPTQKFDVGGFKWVEGKGCYVEGASLKKPELLEGVTKQGCTTVVPVRDLSVVVTTDPNGSGYIATFESPQTGQVTCWYADDKAVACQNHDKKGQ